MIQAVNRGRWYRPLYFNNLTHFWDNVDIVYVMHFSDVTLLFEQWIIFKNLQFILLFLNIWTLTFYCFRLKNVFYLFLVFRFSNHRLFWLSKLPSNHLVGCPTKDFCEFALTELHTPVWYIVGMRRTSRIEIKMSSLCIVVTFFLNWGQRSRSKNWN